LLKVACCDTALYFSEWNYYIPFSTLTNEVFVVVSYNSYYSWLTIFWLILPPEF